MCSREVLMARVCEFVSDEGGQDLIEYALLAATIGLVGAAAWNAMRLAIGVGYQNMDTGSGGAYNLWESPAPQ